MVTIEGVDLDFSERLDHSKKSLTGPTNERTPQKPEYLIALSRNLLNAGPLGFGPMQFLMGITGQFSKNYALCFLSLNTQVN